MEKWRLLLDGGIRKREKPRTTVWVLPLYFLRILFFLFENIDSLVINYSRFATILSFVSNWITRCGSIRNCTYNEERMLGNIDTHRRYWTQMRRRCKHLTTYLTSLSKCVAEERMTVIIKGQTWKELQMMRSFEEFTLSPVITAPRNTLRHTSRNWHKDYMTTKIFDTTGPIHLALTGSKVTRISIKKMLL